MRVGGADTGGASFRLSEAKNHAKRIRELLHTRLDLLGVSMARTFRKASRNSDPVIQPPKREKDAIRREIEEDLEDFEALQQQRPTEKDDKPAA